MSFHVVRWIECDYPGCGLYIEGGTDQNLSRVEQRAARSGWLNIEGRYLCPEHHGITAQDIAETMPPRPEMER